MDTTQTAILEPEQDQQKQVTPGSTVRLINQIKRANRKRLSREGIHVSLYYGWLKDFMEAGKARLKGDSTRNANENEVKQLQSENNRLKALAGEQALELCLLKKSLNA